MHQPVYLGDIVGTQGLTCCGKPMGRNHDHGLTYVCGGCGCHIRLRDGMVTSVSGCAKHGSQD